LSSNDGLAALGDTPIPGSGPVVSVTLLFLTSSSEASMARARSPAHQAHCFFLLSLAKINSAHLGVDDDDAF
jgi:hypothetical protein